ncbi:methionyl-tRNA formyltransferase, mitochondrial-like [Xylocopa sonorina]|uniref:methionyl-tRNA formyltransferase, mitochondrial n=1 Tax=Xylocopa sonorina TaxID=1818115 RepID=UPI00403A989E
MPTFNHMVHNTIKFLCALKRLNKTFFASFNLQIHKCYAPYKESYTVPKNERWRVLFFGTDEFAVESLKILYNKYESKALQRLEIVTTQQVQKNAVTKYAEEHKIVINKWPTEVNKYEFDIGIVVSFGHLIPSKIIKAFPLGMINVHGSLLPRWRGAAPIVYTLMNGDSQAGITLMKIKPKKFDVGEIVLQEQIAIDENETLPELNIKLAKLGANLLEKIFKNLPSFLQSAKPQDNINATYAPKVTSEISLIKWTEMSAKNVHDLYRALLGLYPLTSSYENTKIKIFDITKIESESIAKMFEGELPGMVIYHKKSKTLIIKCKDESFVSVKKIAVQGKPSMTALDFYNGFISGKKKTKILFS